MKRTMVATLVFFLALAVGGLVDHPVAQETSRGQAVDRLTSLMMRDSRAVATHLVANATPGDATGQAYLRVVSNLVRLEQEADAAERRSGLSEEDRSIIRLAKPDAAFGLDEIFDDVLDATASQEVLPVEELSQRETEQVAGN
jgi:hypothetical protein